MALPLSPDEAHRVLGVPRGSDRSTLVAAYYTRLRAVHPQLHPLTGRWAWVQQVEAAYQQLLPLAPEQRPGQPERPAMPAQPLEPQEALPPETEEERRQRRRALRQEVAYHAAIVLLFVGLIMLVLYLTPDPPPPPPVHKGLQGW